MVISTIFMITALIMSFKHMGNHLNTYTKPNIQRTILRILLMVPVYSFTSWIALISPPIGVPAEAFRGIYEAFV